MKSISIYFVVLNFFQFICNGYRINHISTLKKMVLLQNSVVHNELSVSPSISISNELSLELYACESGTQDLVVGQISNWIRAEIFTLKEFSNYSIVLASLDGKRVVHMISWKSGNKGISNIFNNFRRRADGIDGTPAALKESTHLYEHIKSFPNKDRCIFVPNNSESYPLISLDIFNNYRIDKQSDLINILESISTSPTEIPLVNIPEFKSIHLLSSKDSTVCVILGIWKGDSGFKILQNNDKYSSIISKAINLSVRGTYTDLIGKTTDPSRLYYIADLYHS